MSALQELPPLIETDSAAAIAINAEIAAGDAAEATALQHYIRAGELMLAEQVRRGETWNEWAEQNVSKTMATVRGYMRLAQYQSEIRHCRSFREAILWLRELGLQRRCLEHRSSAELTEARRAKAQEMLANGSTHREIARAIGCARGSVAYFLDPNEHKARVVANRKRRNAEAAAGRKAAEEKRFQSQLNKARGDVKVSYGFARQLMQALGRIGDDHDTSPAAKVEAAAAYELMVKVEQHLVRAVGCE